MIKSHVVKYLGAAVEISSVIMKSFGAVSKPFKGRRRCSLTYESLHMFYMGILPVRRNAYSFL